MRLKLTHVLLGMGLLVAVTGWLVTREERRQPVRTAGAGCPLPPEVSPGAAPLQSPVPGDMPGFNAPGGERLTPLAGFSVDARVLSRQDYHLDRESRLSPTDLALGWQRMADDDVLAHLSFSQSGRFFRYQWQDAPPLPPAQITLSASNMHMIPADAQVRRALAQVRPDDQVRIEGWLVEASAADGWHWRSSLTREDDGAGACELVYVCALTATPRRR